ncbi:MAG: zinc-ribbon domain-containing protein [Candidatus Omnitrophica bacterium]|nr:zinc-ribbon domain-containing protein [Candidatus Omnitrophota bacterium]
MAEYICPHCGKPIYDDEALLCLYCGENLERGVGVLGKMKYSFNWIVVAVILAALISLVLIAAV